jgi:hypothetical protein
MSFDTVLRDTFPGAVDEREFVRATHQALQPLGFLRESTLVCVATCRDEISQSIVDHVRELWGLSFNLAGLAGMPFAGKTGFGAALHHAPQVDGRERYVFYAGPHIGIGPEGEAGVVERKGRQEPSMACGALLALLGELQDDRLGAMDDSDDVEQGVIRKHIGGPLVSARDALPDLIGLTHLTHDVILNDVERILAATVDPSKADHAVITGVQIHGPGMKNYIQPRTMYAVADGSRRSVALAPDVCT